MLVPGVTFTATGRVNVGISADNIPDFISGGFGFRNNGELCIDIAAPVGDFYVKGFRVSAAGAIYGVSVPDSGAFAEGIYRNNDGRIVYDPADPVVFASGNPITVNDLIATD